MFTLLLKFSILFGLPIATAIVWRKRTQAQVRALLFAFVLFAISFVAHLLFDRTVSRLLEHEAMLPVIVFFLLLWDVLYAPWIIHSVIFGLIQEGSRWLIFRYAPTKIVSWHDGVLFGIAYSFFALIIMVGEYFYYGTPDLSQYPFFEKMTHLNWFFWWWSVFAFSWQLVFNLLVLNVCTSLAVIASVRKRKILYLALAVLVYVVYANAPTIVSQVFLNMQVDTFYIDSPWLRFAVDELWRLPLALLTLVLIFRLCKTMSEVGPKNWTTSEVV